MRYALISDIHANLPALEAVLDHIAAIQDITATYHLGDLVGYAPWPDEEDLSHLSFAWTKEHTSPETKRFLGALPFRLDVKPNGGHATPSSKSPMARSPWSTSELSTTSRRPRAR